eukprot:TRINITY_DN5303_c0_g2_i1.p1 TRINITY_DN5303_c0_g2~~TRINITY_DN5303_c0_g2_i1.p1  ORF type:complete len:425 (+),score=56.82 TRINITY_DN5303_c0_g2_i1:397-1671(+)
MKTRDGNFLQREDFIFSYPLFCNCPDLLTAILKQFSIAFKLQSSERIQNLISMLELWVTANSLHIFTYNQYNKMASVLTVGSNTNSENGEKMGLILQILNSQYKKHRLLPSLPESWTIREFVSAIMKFSPKDVAEQITMIYTEIIAQIQPCELVRQAWDKESCNYEAPFVTGLQDWLTRLCTFGTLTAVLEDPLDRKNFLSFSVQVLFHLHSWNDLCGIILVFGGITNSAVHRLSIWEDVGDEIFEKFTELRVLTNPYHNSSNMRKALEEATVCLPYVNIFLRDLTFANDGNPSYKASPDASSEGNVNRVNKRKAELSSGIVRNLIRSRKKATHAFPIREDIRKTLLSCPRVTNRQLHTTSLWIDPQNRTQPPTKPEWVTSKIIDMPPHWKQIPWKNKNTSLQRWFLAAFVVALLSLVIYQYVI